jgi:hypothetical protein
MLYWLDPDLEQESPTVSHKQALNKPETSLKPLLLLLLLLLDVCLLSVCCCVAAVRQEGWGGGLPTELSVGRAAAQGRPTELFRQTLHKDVLM